jgi:hypothetical protein
MRKSLGDMWGPLCGMPDGTTLSARAVTNSAAPPGKRLNKTSSTSQGSRTRVAFCHGHWPRVIVGFEITLRGEVNV